MTEVLFSFFIVAAALVGFCVLRSGEDKADDEATADHPGSIEDLCVLIRNAVNRALYDDRPRGALTDDDLANAGYRRERLRRAALESCLGDSGDREYVKSFIRDYISGELRLTDDELRKLIPFDCREKMTPKDQFEYLYVLYSRVYTKGVFDVLVRKFDWPVESGVIDESCITASLSKADIVGDYIDRLELVVQRCYEILYGHDCADLLITDSSVDGVSAGVGGKTRVEYNYMDELLSEGSCTDQPSLCHEVVFCTYKGRLLRLRFLSFERPEALERVVRNICRYNMRTSLSQKDPVLVGSLKDNSRVVVARPPVSDGWTFYIRKFTGTSPSNISSLLIHDNADAVIALLKALIGAEFNLAISGNTGGGKTTLLKSLVSFIDPHYTLRVVETSFELNLNNLYPERNVHVLQERGNFTIYDAVTATKKMDTDVLIIGEVNEPKLAGAYIQVAQSGSRMALTTLHHETTESLIGYLRNALVSECGISDVDVAESQVVQVLRFDVHMIRDMDGNHYIERITEIIPIENEDYPTSESEAAREFYRRVTDGSRYMCRDIIHFDRQSMCYRMSGQLSKASSDRITARLGKECSDELRRCLCNMNYSIV